MRSQNAKTAEPVNLDTAQATVESPLRPSANDSSRTSAPTQTKRPSARAQQRPASESGAKKPGPRRAVTKVDPAAAAPQTLFFSRDESWLRFNGRVLEEAQDETNPLLERVKFLAITASNLDEFVEIRVAGMLQRIEDGYDQPHPADEGGLTPDERLTRLSGLLADFVAVQYLCWNDLLLPALERERIRILRWGALDRAARAHALKFYADEVDPLLTPVTIDPSHPFPRVLNKALCIALLLEHKRKGNPSTMLGVVTVPRSLQRLVPLPSPPGTYDFILLHELIEAQVERMFPGYRVLSRSAFRVTRNSNLYLQEEESRSVLESVREELHNRRKGDAVRLEIESTADEEIVERLRTNFELDPWQVFRTRGPVNLSRLMNLVSEVKRPELKYPEFKPRPLRLHGASDAAGTTLFDELRRGDLLLHHPFDSYETVEQFIEAGALDPAVISIKQTLYRTSKDSSIFRALTHAGQSKDVTVVVELMARFDEDSNIRWARELEDAGVGVYHGVFGLKTHCKLALVVRRDSDGVIRRYAHLGTGNYNPVTARFYTDISLLTGRPDLTSAVQAVFNYLTAEAESDAYKPLLVAPLSMAARFSQLIEREAAHARAGRPAAIVAKVNGLLDRGIIEALYKASQSGVEIDLIVRGMCSLRPGVRGLSDRIRVRSIVGQMLEHSRIFSFENGGEPEVFCGSADWMTRNLYERCEVVFPVFDAALSRRLREEILAAYLADTLKARLLQPDGVYLRAKKVGYGFSSQQYLIGLADGTGLGVAIPK